MTPSQLLSRGGVAVVAALLLSPALASCASTDATDSSNASAERIDVVANFYPVQWLAESIGGDAVRVSSLTPEGVEPHDLSLDAKAQAALQKADSVLYLGAGFQPDVERAVALLPDRSVATDLLTAPGVDLLPAPRDLGKESLAGGKDPHVWLDPRRMVAMADAVSASLREASPEAAVAIEANHKRVTGELEALDQRYASALKSCRSEVLVTGHAAFGYLADRYGLTQIAIAGVSPEDEPTAKQLRSTAALAKANDVSTVFYEEVLPDRLAKTVAEEIGARADLLSALEFDPRSSAGSSADYVSVMQDNLNRIVKGLACSG